MGTCTDFMCNFFSSHRTFVHWNLARDPIYSAFFAIFAIFSSLALQHEHIHVPTDEGNTAKSLTLVPFRYFAPIQLLKRMTFFIFASSSDCLMRRYSAGDLSMAENSGCWWCYKKKPAFHSLFALYAERQKQCSTWSIWGRLFFPSIANEHKEPDYNMNCDKGKKA